MKKFLLPAFAAACSCLFSCSCDAPRQDLHVKSARDSVRPINPHVRRDTVIVRHGSGDHDFAADTAFRECALVIDDRYILLTGYVDTTWINTRPEEDQASWDGAYAASCKVDTGKLPRVFSRLYRSLIYVFDENGNSSAASITGFRIFSASIPHFGEVQGWNGGGDVNATPLSEPEKLSAIFNSGAQYLVATYEPDNTGGGPFFYASLYPGPEKRAGKFDRAIRYQINESDILDEAAHSQEFQSNAKAYQEISGPHADWKSDESTDIKFESLGASGSTIFCLLRYSSGNPCGGDFFFEGTQLWEQHDGGKPVLLGSWSRNYELSAAFDMDGDGVPELILKDDFGEEQLFKKSGESWESYRSWGIPFRDCGC